MTEEFKKYIKKANQEELRSCDYMAEQIAFERGAYIAFNWCVTNLSQKNSVTDLSQKLAIAVEALEYYRHSQDKPIGDDSLMAKQALSKIKGDEK